MKIAKDLVVNIEYTLTDETGQVLDSSKDGGPLAYLHGHQNIIPGLENELEGKSTGDSLKVTVTPENGYGERKEELLMAVPRDQFPEGDIEVGMQFQVDTDMGPMVVMVAEVQDAQVILDGNHPLAGITLNFDVTVGEIRSASAEEIEHGHVHGEGGHHH